jgi:hypothetical protein
MNIKRVTVVEGLKGYNVETGNGFSIAAGNLKLSKG